jgi:hypothetical protein
MRAFYLNILMRGLHKFVASVSINSAVTQPMLVLTILSTIRTMNELLISLSFLFDLQIGIGDRETRARQALSTMGASVFRLEIALLFTVFRRP